MSGKLRLGSCKLYVGDPPKFVGAVKDVRFECAVAGQWGSSYYFWAVPWGADVSPRRRTIWDRIADWYWALEARWLFYGYDNRRIMRGEKPIHREFWDKGYRQEAHDGT